MAFCKVCVCGKKIVFERRMSFPSACPSCGRNTVKFPTYSEDDPRVEELLMEYNRNSDKKNPEENHVSISTEKPGKRFYLKLNNGKEILIPEGESIIGRTATGAEELAEYPSVSREHLRIKPRGKTGVLIEDISRYGTLIDGCRIEKNKARFVQAGSKITLCDLETQLMFSEGEKE